MGVTVETKPAMAIGKIAKRVNGMAQEAGLIDEGENFLPAQLIFAIAMLVELPTHYILKLLNKR